MPLPDSNKDYYKVLGADESASIEDIDRQYKRMAARVHPDRGGSEEAMKSLNEAYGILKDKASRQAYDSNRRREVAIHITPISAPPAQDIGVFGHGLSALLCLLVGLFLLVLVRSQWMWFLWPLGILAILVIVFGVMMARSAMVALRTSLPTTNPLRRYVRLQEVMFWTAVLALAYGIYFFLRI